MKGLDVEDTARRELHRISKRGLKVEYVDDVWKKYVVVLGISKRGLKALHAPHLLVVDIYGGISKRGLKVMYCAEGFSNIRLAVLYLKKRIESGVLLLCACPRTPVVGISKRGLKEKVQPVRDLTKRLG